MGWFSRRRQHKSAADWQLLGIEAGKTLAEHFNAQDNAVVNGIIGAHRLNPLAVYLTWTYVELHMRCFAIKLNGFGAAEASDFFCGAGHAFALGCRPQLTSQAVTAMNESSPTLFSYWDELQLREPRTGKPHEDLPEGPGPAWFLAKSFLNLITNDDHDACTLGLDPAEITSLAAHMDAYQKDIQSGYSRLLKRRGFL